MHTIKIRKPRLATALVVFGKQAAGLGVAGTFRKDLLRPTYPLLAMIVIEHPARNNELALPILR